MIMKSKLQNGISWTLCGHCRLINSDQWNHETFGAPSIVEGMTKLGVGPYISLLGHNGNRFYGLVPFSEDF